MLQWFIMELHNRSAQRRWGTPPGWGAAEGAGEWEEGMVLSKKEVERLIALLGMLGSAHDGEVVNAARLAQRLIGGAGVTWADVLNGQTRGDKYSDEDMQAAVNYAYRNGYTAGVADSKQKPVTRIAPASWAGLARSILADHVDELSEWERGFIESWSTRPGHWTVSDRQRRVFEDLVDRFDLDTPEN